MIKIFVLFMMLMSPAFGQSVQQSGNVTPGHVTQWITDGVVGDGGPLGGGASFNGMFNAFDFLCSSNMSNAPLIISCGLSATGTNTWNGIQNFSGGATAPTRTPGDSTTNLATTAFVTGGAATFLGIVHTWTALQSFTGGATAPTRSPGDNTTNVATTAFVRAAVPISVTDYGAVCNGSTDDAAAFQAALTAIAAAGGGLLFIPASANGCRVASTVTYSGQFLRITGAGIRSMIIKAFTSGDLFQFTGLQNIQIDHLFITGGQSDISGSMIHFANTGATSGNFWIDSIMTTGGYDVITFDGGAQTFVNDVMLMFNTNHAIHFTGTYAGNSFISGLQAYTIGNGAGVNNGSGILVENGDGFFWQNILVSSYSNGINVHPFSGNFVKNMVLSNVNADGINRMGSGGSSINIDGTTGGVVALERFYFSNVIASGSPGYGFFIAGATAFNCSNCAALVNALDGFRIGATSSNIKLDGWTAEGNSSSFNGGVDNTSSGVQIDDGAIKVALAGGRAGLQSTTDVTNSQKYGINITGSTHSAISITNNNLVGNATGSINGAAGLAGSTNIVVNNIAYNPVGTTAPTSTGTTGATITAGPSSETHYILQSANFNAVVTKGSQTLCTVPSATIPCVVQLGPNETYSVAWTTTQPTYTKDVH